MCVYGLTGVGKLMVGDPTAGTGWEGVYLGRGEGVGGSVGVSDVTRVV